MYVMLIIPTIVIDWLALQKHFHFMTQNLMPPSVKIQKHICLTRNSMKDSSWYSSIIATTEGTISVGISHSRFLRSFCSKSKMQN
jgi:hypothetical protein